MGLVFNHQLEVHFLGQGAPGGQLTPSLPRLIVVSRKKVVIFWGALTESRYVLKGISTILVNLCSDYI